MMRFKNMLKIFSKTEVQEDKTHPCPPLESEGVKVSCAEHTDKNLFTYLPIHLFTFKKVAFTLAEVLITLGIIGVVAALTLPTLISNHKKQVYVNQLKKVVNTLENAAQLAVADEGVSSFQDTLLNCTLSDAYLCGHSWKDEYQDAANKYFKILNSSVVDNDTIIPDYKYLNGQNYSSYWGLKRIFTLNDGAIIYISSAWAVFHVDVNGNKGPNIYGRDLFSLALGPQGNIIDGTSTTTDVIAGHRTVLDNKNCENSQYFSRKTGCFYYEIVSDGWKMDY